MKKVRLELIDLQDGHFVESDPMPIGDKASPIADFYLGRGEELAGKVLTSANAPCSLYLVRITCGRDYLRYRFGKFYPAEGKFIDLGSENPYLVERL